MSGVEDVEGAHRSHKKPYSAHNPIPTIQGYREEKQRRQDQYGVANAEDEDDIDKRSRKDKLSDAYNAFTHGAESHIEGDQPYDAENKNIARERTEAPDHAGRVTADNKELPQDQDADAVAEDTTEGVMTEQDPKKARKHMKKHSADGTERQVTDPVTHLPVPFTTSPTRISSGQRRTNRR